MSAPPSRQNNGVFIPPRRNIPARVARGASSNALMSTPTIVPGPPSPNEVNRASTVGVAAGAATLVQITPRTTSGVSVNIPSRVQSAQALPDRIGAFSNPNQRMSFVPPPRRTVPGQAAAPPYPPRPSIQMPQPPPASGSPYPDMQQYPPIIPFPSPDAYQSNQPSSISYFPPPSTYSTPNPYVTPTIQIPEIPQTSSNLSTGNEFNRRPLSFHGDSEVYIPPRRETKRYSFSESSVSSDLEEDPSRLIRHTSDGSVYTPHSGPVIPPRSGGFVIPMRNTSVQKVNIDTLLDEGGMAFAAPRHNIEEALSKWRQARELAVKEKDLLREAKALSNIGCTLRSQGKLHESLADLRDAWDVSTRYVEEAAWRSNSLWLQLVMRHADIDSDIEPDEASIRAASTRSSTDPAQDASQGPPIVVWFMQLTTNLGNAYFCLGQYEEAIQYHDMCRRLAEAVLEEYPLPPGFNLPNLQRSLSSSSLNRSDGDGEPRVSLDAGPSTKTKIKLSYLHRQTLLAQSRSLTHLGLCHQQLGLDDEALTSHAQAESIVTFYSARLLSSTSTRRASLSNPSAIPTEVYAAEAAIVANVGTSYYAKGRLPLAIQYHERATKLFSNIQDRVGKAKEDANLGCLYIEVGRTLNSMQWVSNMEASTDRGKIDLDECRRYWGPPRLETINMGIGAPDETAPEMIGQPLFDQGILALYEVEKVMRNKEDWIGEMFVWANLAVGYVLLHQPYLALFYLSRVVHEPVPDSPSSAMHSPPLFLSGQPGAYRRGGIPPVLYPHVYFTLCQVLFILTRLIQEDPNRPLFPPPGTGDALDHGTGIPVMNPAPINRLLKALDVPNIEISSINDGTVTELLEGCRKMLDGIMKMRAQAAATLYAIGSASLDMMRQKSVVTSATCGKVALELGASPVNFDDEVRRVYFEEAKGASAKSMRDMRQAVKAGDTTSSSPYVGGSGSSERGLLSPISTGPPFLMLNGVFGTGEAAEGVIGMMLELATNSELIRDEHGQNPLTSLGPSLLALTADLIAYAINLHQRRLNAGMNLLDLFGLPIGQDPADASGRLLAAARKVLGNQIGLCEECARMFVKALSVEDEEVEVSFSAGGNRKVEAGRLVYPCEHYKWNVKG